MFHQPGEPRPIQRNLRGVSICVALLLAYGFIKELAAGEWDLESGPETTFMLSFVAVYYSVFIAGLVLLWRQTRIGWSLIVAGETLHILIIFLGQLSDLVIGDNSMSASQVFSGLVACVILIFLMNKNVRDHLEISRRRLVLSLLLPSVAIVLFFLAGISVYLFFDIE